MADEAASAGVHIDRDRLSERLGIPVLLTVATTGAGVSELAAAAAAAAPSTGNRIAYPGAVERTLDELGWALGDATPVAARGVGLLWLGGDEEAQLCLERQLSAALPRRPARAGGAGARGGAGRGARARPRRVCGRARRGHGQRGGAAGRRPARAARTAEHAPRLGLADPRRRPLRHLLVRRRRRRRPARRPARELGVRPAREPVAHARGREARPERLRRRPARRQVRALDDGDDVRARADPPDRHDVLPRLQRARGQRLPAAPRRREQPALQRARPEREGGAADGARPRLRDDGDAHDADPRDPPRAVPRNPPARARHPVLRAARRRARDARLDLGRGGADLGRASWRPSSSRSAGSPHASYPESARRSSSSCRRSVCRAR